MLILIITACGSEGSNDASSPQVDTAPIHLSVEAKQLNSTIDLIATEPSIQPGHPNAFGTPNYWAQRFCYAILIELRFDISKIVHPDDQQSALAQNWEDMAWTSSKTMVESAIAQSEITGSGILEISAKEAFTLAQYGIPSLATGKFSTGDYFIGIVRARLGIFNPEIGPTISKGGKKIEEVNEKILCESSYYYYLEGIRYFYFLKHL